ncbi:MAG: MBL fold metallo-hydrolase [Promethearchaeota archaeon]
MQITWLGHAAFKIKTNNGKIIFLDPFQLSEDEEKADIIISTHIHGDHFSRLDIKKILKEDTFLLGPKSEEDKLSKLNGRGLNLNEPMEIDEIKIELVPSYTIIRGTHPKSNEWAGIIIEVEGKRIYHAGDTERIPEMKDLAQKNITVALLPCGGQFTMDFEMSTDCALDIKPEIVVPMHSWGANLSEYKELMESKDSSIKVEILENKLLEI